jgi:M6 family metalloprotease-like protein
VRRLAAILLATTLAAPSVAVSALPLRPATFDAKPKPKPKPKKPAPRPAAPACPPSLASGTNPTPNEAATGPSRFFRSTGPARAVALYVDFADAPANETTQQVYDWTIPQTVAWFPEVSYGRFSLQVTAVQRWYRMPRPAAEYRGQPSATLLEDAVRTATADVDFAGTDLVLVAVAHGSHVTSTYSFPSAVADGTTIRYGVIVGDHNRAATLGSVLTSDLGRLMGLPELGDSAAPTDPATGAGFENFITPVGRWSIMSDPHPHNHVLAWEKWKLGWLTAAQVSCATPTVPAETTLTPTETPGGVKMVVAQVSPSRAYVAELREPLGMDALNCDHGVLLYTVDASVANARAPVNVVPTVPGSQCGPKSNALLGIGTGEVSAYEDAAVRLELLATTADGYRVRLTRK